MKSIGKTLITFAIAVYGYSLHAQTPPHQKVQVGIRLHSGAVSALQTHYTIRSEPNNDNSLYFGNTQSRSRRTNNAVIANPEIYAEVKYAKRSFFTLGMNYLSFSWNSMLLPRNYYHIQYEPSQRKVTQTLISSGQFYDRYTISLAGFYAGVGINFGKGRFTFGGDLTLRYSRVMRIELTRHDENGKTSADAKPFHRSLTGIGLGARGCYAITTRIKATLGMQFSYLGRELSTTDTEYLNDWSFQSDLFGLSQLTGYAGIAFCW